MKDKSQAIDELAALARAIGHPHRVTILRFLAQSRSCICGGIVETLPIAQSTVSQHLKKLREAGWIHGEIEGPRVCYCLVPNVMDRFRDLFERTLSSKKDAS